MLLRAKLLVGFSVMLALMAILAFTNWRGMENMSRQAEISNEVESTLSNMILAEVRQYQFMLTRAEQAVTLTRKDIDLALKVSQELDSRLRQDSHRATNREITVFLENYRKKFDSLVISRTESDVQLSQLTDLSAAITDQFATLHEGLHSVYMASGSLNAFNAYATIVNASRAYDGMRLRVWAFNADPTREKAAKVLEEFDKAYKLAMSNQPLMRVERDINQLQSMVKSMESYRAHFEVLAEKTFTVTLLDNEIQQGLEKALGTLRQLITQSSTAFNDARDTTNLLAFLVASIAILVGVGIAWVLSSNVQRQLGKDPGELATIAQRVSGGDFNIADGSVRLGVYGHIVSMVEAMREHIEKAQRESERARGESERAHEAVQAAETASREASIKTERLMDTAQKLEKLSTVLTSASVQLAAQIGQSERGASVQAARMTETATAMTQMNATVLEVARNAGTAADMSATTRQKAEAGTSVARQAVDSIQQVQTQSTRLRTDMAALDESARAISQIMGVISDIADQTNLLALNAAIEAARAGEAGRGFAVVADEVRKLAEKTMSSTQDVGNAIAAIQQATNRSVGQVDASVQAIEDATGFVNQSGAALVEIVTMVDRTADQVRAIAAASEEQSSTSDEINRTIGEVEVIASENARAMGEANAAVAELASQSQILAKLIEDMKRG